MVRHILYLLLLATSIPLMGMEKGTLQVLLGAPEYWKVDGTQCDLDEKGEPCPVGPREQQLELKYVTAFPKLKAYLDENENKFRGFDPKMFNLLKNCLQFAHIYKDSAGTFEEQNGIEKEIEYIYRNHYSPGKVIDALYISRLAGLHLIEKIALKAFKEKKDYRGKLVRLYDVYPSFDSLDQVRPGDNMSDYAIEEDVQDQSLESESESEESSESQSSSESESEEEINELPQFNFFFEPNNFSPEAFLRSLEKRFPQTKQQKTEETAQKETDKKELIGEQKALIAVPSLWFLNVNSENEFSMQATNRIKMHQIRIKDAMQAAAKVKHTAEREPLIEKAKLEKKEKPTEKIVPKTLWGRLLSLVAFIFWK